MKPGELRERFSSRRSRVLLVVALAVIAAAGSSYGGGLSLLLAAADHRIGAVSADITWNNLAHAFFPNFAGSQPGVFKKLWVGELFGNAFPETGRGAASVAGLTPSAI